MQTTLKRAALFALYQTSLLLGVLFLPIALATRRVGVHLPFGALVDRLGDAYGATR